MTQVAVVGGGIAGLCAAYQAARRGCQVTLLEAAPRVGGVIATERRDGFLIEGGPDGFLDGRRDIPDLCAELGLQGELLAQRERRVLALEHGRLAPLEPGRAARLLELATESADAAAGFLTLRGGLGTLVAALELRVAGGLRLDARVEAIRRADAGFRLAVRGAEPVDAESVVLAVPAPAASALVAELDPELAALLAELELGSSATISLAYRRAEVAHPLDASGLVVPREEACAMVACTFCSSKFEGRAPEDGVLLRAHVGRYGSTHLVDADDATLVAAVAGELASLLGIVAPPQWYRVFRWPRALPRYDAARDPRLAVIREHAAAAGLVLAGAAVDRVGLSDCVRSGLEAGSAAGRAVAVG